LFLYLVFNPHSINIFLIFLFCTDYRDQWPSELTTALERFFEIKVSS